MFCPIPVLCWHGRSWTFYTDSLQLLVSPVFISNLLFNLTSVSLVLLSCSMSVFFNNLYVIFRSGWTLVCHHTVSDGRYVSSLVMSCSREPHIYIYKTQASLYEKHRLPVRKEKFCCHCFTKINWISFILVLHFRCPFLVL